MRRTRRPEASTTRNSPAPGANTVSASKNGDGVARNAVIGALHAPARSVNSSETLVSSVWPCSSSAVTTSRPRVSTGPRQGSVKPPPGALPAASPTSTLPPASGSNVTRTRVTWSGSVACQPTSSVAPGAPESFGSGRSTLSVGGRSTVPMTVKPKRTLLGASGT